MDEHREEREELEALVRDDEDDAREQAVIVNYGDDPQGTWTRGVRAAAERRSA